MPVFQYSVRDATGALRTGSSEAESQEILKRRLQEQGFQVNEVKQTGKSKQAGTGFGRVKLNDLSIFCRQFSTMIDAGVSLVRALDVLGEQTQNPKLKRILREIQTEVEGGQQLSKAMQKYPRVFSNLFIGLIKAGEVGGVLEESLQRLSHFLEKDMELRRKVKSAMTYPVLVAIMASGIVGFIVTWFIPQWKAILLDLGLKANDLPAPTKFLIDVSDTVVHYWWMCIIGLVVLIVAYRLFVSTRFGRRVADRVKLKIPIFGKLHHKVCMARFSRTMGTLLTSGVPILQAMETVAGTVGNTIMADALLEARARIREGDRIGDPLEESRLFPPMVVHMIGVGEESGSLDFMLQKIADFYESEVEAALASLTAAIEPIMIVSLGFVVGFIVISMFMPLAKVISQLSSGQDSDSKS